MFQHLKRISLLLPLLLAGCGESPFGAYEASIQTGKEAPRVMGIAIIQKDQIIADGQTVKVAEWRSESGLVTAFGDGGQRLVQFTKNAQGDLIQTSEQSQVVYKKYTF